MVRPKRLKTFDDILADHGGAGPGFDLLRLVLALAILVSHVAAIAGTRGIIPSTIEFFIGLIGQAHAATTDGVPAAANMMLQQTGITRPIVLTHVPMFFALSGFLVVGSAFRTKRVLPFLGLRFLRIFPALCVEVTLSALLIGTAITTLPLSEYFSDRLFWTYFGNVAGFVQMELPGVIFDASRDRVAVNANLWTLPAEFHSYLILSVLVASGIIFNRVTFSVIFILISFVLLVANFAFDYNATAGLLAGDVNVYYFFVGAMAYLWRDRVPHSLPLCVGAAISTYFLMKWKHGVYIAPLPLTYVTVYLGLTNFPQFRLVRSGDYSYGIYLYGFPIIQCLITMVPAVRGSYFALMWPALICTCLFAVFSWHLIEKRFLRLRKYLSPKSAEIAARLHSTRAP